MSTEPIPTEPTPTEPEPTRTEPTPVAPVATMGRRRLLLIPLVLAGLSMIGPFSIDTPYPAFSHLQAEFGVGAETTQQLVAAYLLAFALMSIFHGPLSDAVGRRPVMLGGLAVYALASAAAALAPSMPVLIGCRVVQGLSAGGALIVSRTVIRDLYDGAQAQRLMARVMMIFGLAPAIAPIIGGFLLQLGPWRGVFWFLVAIAVSLMVAVVVVLPETHRPSERTPLQVRPLVSGLVSVARNARFHRVAWAAALSFGAFFLYIGAAAIVVVDLLGRGETDFWMLFVPLISGVVLGSWVSSRAAGRVSGRRLVTVGLAIALAGAVVNLVLALVPATADLPYAVLGPAVIGCGASMGNPTMQLAVLDLFPRARGAAASMTTFLTLLLNGLGAGLLAPVITSSLALLAGSALLYLVGASALWAWHLRVDRRHDGPGPAAAAWREAEPDRPGPAAAARREAEPDRPGPAAAA